jgi:hypothetical protein
MQKILISFLFLITMAASAEGIDPTGVTIEMAPNSPVLFTVNTNITLSLPSDSARASAKPSTVSLTAPWFGANFTFVNYNKVPVTFVTIVATVVGTVQGVKKTSTIHLGPSDVNYFTSQTFITTPDSTSTSTVIANHTSQPLLFYVQGIEPNYDSTSLDVTLKFDGYYGSQTEPLGRLSKVIHFTTN